jgi:hypothetical protein
VASPMENERSGPEDEKEIVGGRSLGFRFSASREACTALATDRFDEPEVDTVESDEDDGWEGCPSRAWFMWLGSCCWAPCGSGADTDLLPCCSPGVVWKAYGAIGADVPLYPVPLDWPLYIWFRGACEPRCCEWWCCEGAFW